MAGRSQNDRKLYSEAASKDILDSEGIEILEDSVTEICEEGKKNCRR